MKKLLFFALVAGGAVAFTSCSKKDYTCTCTDNATGTVNSTNVYKGVKKEDAEATCQLIVFASETCTLTEN